ncbi:MAG: tRNA 2-thiouridine(34) synthase MnmA [Spirochaetales bacterium]|jgi:tRNA-specific 2-thiouridylase|nr:tRNA 2-thiouridine(34) synthase MnmA [Spirochaetales bacterium]
MNPKALIAMSGGVDSCVAAYLMKQRGFDCAGAMMRLFENEEAGISREKSCCSIADARHAREAARKIGIPFFIYNFAGEFREHIMRRFADSYQCGKTPNPCIDCNRFIKFEKFLARARLLEYERIATGHYARIEEDPGSGRYLLKKGLDPAKDQSYVLYAMTQAQLERTVFPLGELTKPEVRAIAEARGFANAHKKESQDICFIPDGDYANFIERFTGRVCESGPVVDRQGNILGRHKGAIRFTRGQRRGIGVSTSGERLYVCATDIQANTVVLGTEDSLYSQTLTAEDINLIPFAKLDKPLRVKAKIRYRMPEQPAVVEQTGEDTLRVSFDEPQRAITRGQAVVLYDGDLVVGGGTITG